jgi:superfamily II DNA or RNA helicase
MGPVRHAVDPRILAQQRQFEHRLIVRETGFQLSNPETSGIQEVYAQLATDTARNDLILNDVIQSVEDGRSPIVLTERRDHLEFLAERLQGFARHLIVLRGGMRATERREVASTLASIPNGEERVLLATGRFLGEGFDDPRLDTLFLAMPVSWKGTLVQYAGRLHRGHQGKTEVQVYDYVDGLVPVLARMFKKRLRGYRSMGYRGSEGEDFSPLL